MNYCLIFDIGKTNKKAFVFDEHYRIVHETSTRLPETTDDDGDPCEDLAALKNWIETTARAILNDPNWAGIRAVNCTTYGASFVHLDADFEPVAPLYNYLKPFPDDLLQAFLEQYGPADLLSLETASPLLGHLNSGLQLWWLKQRKPLIFKQIKHSLHLPQWVSFVLNNLNGARVNPPVCEMTSLGCHTLLWDFQQNDYHRWVQAEGLDALFPPVVSARGWATGLHDSSAALIPYLAGFEEPFVLISTGTWCISLNPFNQEPLTPAELAQDSLCYLTFEGRPVKAARYFGGHEHEAGVQRLAAEYGVSSEIFQSGTTPTAAPGHPMDVQNALDAYADLVETLVQKQVASTRLAIGQSPVRRLFVDGGFSHNSLYMRRLAAHFPDLEVFSADIAQATALGAALAVHPLWHPGDAPKGLITVRRW